MDENKIKENFGAFVNIIFNVIYNIVITSYLRITEITKCSNINADHSYFNMFYVAKFLFALIYDINVNKIR